MQRIFTGEGSTSLWDELCAFRGVDEQDLQNYVIMAQYVNAVKRIGGSNIVSERRPLSGAQRPVVWGVGSRAVGTYRA